MSEKIKISNDLANIIKEAKKIKTTKGLLDFIEPSWEKEYGWIATCDKQFFIDNIDENDICKLINDRVDVKKENYTDKLCSDVDLIERWNYKNNEYKGKDNKMKYPNRTKLFTDLYPVQIMGDIEKAEIFLLNMNPSMSEKNIDEEIKLNEFKEHIQQYNYNGDNEKSLYFIKSNYEGTGGYDWWTNNSHFGEWITLLEDKYKKKKIDPVTILSGKFCSIEAVPYHARYLTEKINDNLNELPSFLAIQSYINKVIIPKCEKDEAIIICLRKLYDYNIDGYKNVFSSPSVLSAHFGPSSKNKRFVEKTKELLGLKNNYQKSV